MTNTITKPTVSKQLVSLLGASYDVHFDGTIENGPAIEFSVGEGLTVTGSIEGVSEFLACLGHALENLGETWGDNLSAVADAFENATIELQGNGEVQVHYPNFHLPQEA